jgi:hypothetical protein
VHGLGLEGVEVIGGAHEGVRVATGRIRTPDKVHSVSRV